MVERLAAAKAIASLHLQGPPPLLLAVPAIVSDLGLLHRIPATCPVYVGRRRRRRGCRGELVTKQRRHELCDAGFCLRNGTFGSSTYNIFLSCRIEVFRDLEDAEP